MELLLLGEISGSLITEARRALDLNQTQAQICCLMARNLSKGVRQPMSPQHVARKLCMPATRVVSQLKVMTDEKKALIQKLVNEPAGGSLDLRLTFYALTPKGARCAEALLKDFDEINRMLLHATYRKTEDYITQYSRHLRTGLDADAFDSLNNLRDLLKSRKQFVKRPGAVF